VSIGGTTFGEGPKDAKEWSREAGKQGSGEATEQPEEVP